MKDNKPLKIVTGIFAAFGVISVTCALAGTIALSYLLKYEKEYHESF